MWDKVNYGEASYCCFLVSKFLKLIWIKYLLSGQLFSSLTQNIPTSTELKNKTRQNNCMMKKEYFFLFFFLSLINLTENVQQWQQSHLWQLWFCHHFWNFDTILTAVNSLLSGVVVFMCLFVRVTLCFLFYFEVWVLFPMSCQVFLRCVWLLLRLNVFHLCPIIYLSLVYRNPLFLSCWARLSCLRSDQSNVWVSFLCFHLVLFQNYWVCLSS